MATIAAPAGTPIALAAPVEKELTVGLTLPVASAPVSAAVEVAVVWVAATLATEAMEALAAAWRGSAAAQNWVTWFWTGGFSLESGQLL